MTLGPFYGLFIIYGHLVYFSRFGILYQEKSGNPAVGTKMSNLKRCSFILCLWRGLSWTNQTGGQCYNF
jgi:hypothetical protein